MSPEVFSEIMITPVAELTRGTPVLLAVHLVVVVIEGPHGDHPFPAHFTLELAAHCPTLVYNPVGAGSEPGGDLERGVGAAQKI